MSNKLTLNIDEKVITRAKRYARRNKISVSKMVEGYLDSISSVQGNGVKISLEIEWLSASDNNTVTGKDEIINELIRKHRK